MFLALTFLATALFVAGCYSLRNFLTALKAEGISSDDPFFSKISLLFTPNIQDPSLKKQQKRVIWLFCGALLVLFVARSAATQTA